MFGTRMPPLRNRPPSTPATATSRAPASASRAPWRSGRRRRRCSAGRVNSRWRRTATIGSTIPAAAARDSCTGSRPSEAGPRVPRFPARRVRAGPPHNRRGPAACGACLRADRRQLCCQAARRWSMPASGVHLRRGALLRLRKRAPYAPRLRSPPHDAQAADYAEGAHRTERQGTEGSVNAFSSLPGRGLRYCGRAKARQAGYCARRERTPE